MVMIPLRYTRSLFLRSFCVVYLFAFISFYIQIPGLYGDNGILPASSILENSNHKTFSAKIHYQPTLLWLTYYVGLDTQYALDFLALLGSFLAFTGFVSQKFCTNALFTALWSLYFSLYQVGQTFVGNYDELLLEVGFLALLIAPMLPGRRRGPKSTPSDHITFWLVRWFLFRFFLTNGLSKLISGCPKWWDLTAFQYQFESMPLPTPAAWYVHQLPEQYLKLFTIVANLWEIVFPFLFFVPIRSVRIIQFILQLYLQINIIATGNFSFVNLLVIVALLSLLDDQTFYGKKQKNTWYGTIAGLLIHGVILYASFIYLYSLKFQNSKIDSKIVFSKDQFDYVVKNGLNITIWLTFISLTFTILKSLYTTLSDSFKSNRFQIILTTVVYSLVALLLFSAGTVPFASLHSAPNATVPAPLRTVYNRLHKLHAVNQYGLFKKMVGVDGGRQEIVIEGANHLDGPWLEYNFLYKPGKVNNSLTLVAPYTPRLDWQMYFAAYSSYEKQPWLLSLVQRLLNGNGEVLDLLDQRHLPFKQPPKYIRGILYKYRYTGWNERSSPAWWHRERVSEYFPVYSKDSPTLNDYLKARNLLPIVSKHKIFGFWKSLFDSIRLITNYLEPTLFLWSVFTAGCAIITTSAKK